MPTRAVKEPATDACASIFAALSPPQGGHEAEGDASDKRQLFTAYLPFAVLTALLTAWAFGSMDSPWPAVATIVAVAGGTACLATRARAGEADQPAPVVSVGAALGVGGPARWTRACCPGLLRHNFMFKEACVLIVWMAAMHCCALILWLGSGGKSVTLAGGLSALGPLWSAS
jgi:hypothetical protein